MLPGAAVCTVSRVTRFPPTPPFSPAGQHAYLLRLLVCCMLLHIPEDHMYAKCRFPRANAHPSRALPCPPARSPLLPTAQPPSHVPQPQLPDTLPPTFMNTEEALPPAAPPEHGQHGEGRGVCARGQGARHAGALVAAQPRVPRGPHPVPADPGLAPVPHVQRVGPRVPTVCPLLACNGGVGKNGRRWMRRQVSSLRVGCQPPGLAAALKVSGLKEMRCAGTGAWQKESGAQEPTEAVALMGFLHGCGEWSVTLASAPHGPRAVHP